MMNILLANILDASRLCEWEIARDLEWNEINSRPIVNVEELAFTSSN